MTDVILKSIVSDERITATFSDEKLPRFARIGELYITDGILYVYVDLNSDGNGRWFPLTDKKDVYTFEQVVEDTIWSIPYNYQTDNIQIIVYDQFNKVHTLPFSVNIDDSNILLTFDDPARGEAYIIVNKIFEWHGNNLTVGDRTFSVTQDENDPVISYVEINSEFIEILKTGETTFSKDVVVESNLTVGGNQLISGSLNIEGSLTVTGGVTTPDISDLTTRVGSLETLTNSDDFNLDSVQEIVDFIKTHRTDFDALTVSWGDVQNKPTTIAGYNITDTYTKTEIDTNISSSIPTFGTLVGKPTTVDGYGITDAVQEGDSITLTGDVTGTAIFDSDGNISLNTTVSDDSHNHIIDNIDGLQNEFDNIGTYADFEAGYNDSNPTSFTDLGTFQDFLDGLNGL